jgi:signal transduction histidine kinase
MRSRPHLVLRLRRLPVRSVRLRLTALYGGLFLLSGVVLLAITYLLVEKVTSPGRIVSSPDASAHAPARRNLALATAASQHSTDLHQLLIQSGIALAIMTVLSAVLGWIVAGRVLDPLRTITATTRRISEHNLHDRLALPGPPDELKALADTIDELLERLEAAFDSQRLFVANAAHELRSPLATMRASLDVAIAKPTGVPPQLRALDSDLREDLDQADRLLESLLVLARAQRGTLTDQAPVSIEPIVTAALAARRDAITAKGLTVQITLAAICVPGAEILLTRMIENVIENAVRHNQRHGVIDIAATIDAGAAQLTIDSDGPLLNEHAVAQLPQPFRRLDADRTQSDEGHGLGLSIVAAVATAHDGTLTLHARPHGGLRVEITLPGATLHPMTGART